MALECISDFFFFASSFLFFYSCFAASSSSLMRAINLQQFALKFCSSAGLMMKKFSSLGKVTFLASRSSYLFLKRVFLSWLSYQLGYHLAMAWTSQRAIRTQLLPTFSTQTLLLSVFQIRKRSTKQSPPRLEKYSMLGLQVQTLATSSWMALGKKSSLVKQSTDAPTISCLQSMRALKRVAGFLSTFFTSTFSNTFITLSSASLFSFSIYFMQIAYSLNLRFLTNSIRCVQDKAGSFDAINLLDRNYYFYQVYSAINCIQQLCYNSMDKGKEQLQFVKMIKHFHFDFPLPEHSTLRPYEGIPSVGKKKNKSKLSKFSYYKSGEEIIKVVFVDDQQVIDQGTFPFTDPSGKVRPFKEMGNVERIAVTEAVYIGHFLLEHAPEEERVQLVVKKMNEAKVSLETSQVETIDDHFQVLQAGNLPRFNQFLKIQRFNPHAAQMSIRIVISQGGQVIDYEFFQREQKLKKNIEQKQKQA